MWNFKQQSQNNTTNVCHVKQMFLTHKELFTVKIFSPFLTTLPRHGDENNIKAAGTKIGWEDVSWIHMALMVQWQALVNAVMNLQHP
jgi:hypothetical protein